MIDTKEKLYKYLENDRIALGKKRKKPKFFGDEIWKYQILLRKYEYLSNDKKFLNRLKKFFVKFNYHRYSLKLGFSIPINVFESGLSIAHYGTIVVNKNSRVGKNCRIQENVTIGATNGNEKAPLIGDNVFIGSGTKIIGDITIANNVCIGAGSVVVKSVLENGITIAGVPAKKVSQNNSYSNLNSELASKGLL